jgi:hypothetical protein
MPRPHAKSAPPLGYHAFESIERPRTYRERGRHSESLGNFSKVSGTTVYRRQFSRLNRNKIG